METIKISVGVNIELSESTKNFLTDLFRGCTKMVDEKATPLKEEAPKVTALTEHPKQAEPVKQKEEVITIEQIRQELMAKVKDNREAIADKLKELGAQSVTKLEADKYTEFFNFLKGL